MRNVTFKGDTFALSDEVSEFALLEFAEAAADGVDSNTMQGLAALLRLAKECIAEADRGRFTVCARKNRATGDDLFDIIKQAFEVASDRPTVQPSDSSDGPSSTPPRFVSTPADRVVEMFPGRPDLQAGVLRTLQQQETG